MRAAFDAEFALDHPYLNTPSTGIPPAHVADGVAGAVEHWRRGDGAALDLDALVDSTRADFGRLVGIPGDRVAVGATVAQLVAPVAAGLPDGASVLTARGEFTSVVFPFAARSDRGVTVREVPLAELPAAVAGHDLVAVSVVQSADGAVLDLDALRESATAAGVPVLLDTTQAAGWLPLELEWADWVVGDSFKWLLGPRGAAWLGVHPRVWDRTLPVAANWYAGADRWGATIYGLPLDLAADARRFDTAPALLPFVGAAHALAYVAGLEAEEVRRHCVGLADGLRSELGMPPGGSAIVALDVERAADRLTGAGVTASVRGGRARVGFHLYNTPEDVLRVVDAFR